jgi:hypothetical protein
VSRSVELDRFLKDEGFDLPDAAARARELLEDGALTRPGKRAMSEEKLPAAREWLGGLLVRLCTDDDCRRQAGVDGREIVTVSQASCEVCGGSNNRRAALALAERLRAKGLSRLLIVGGTPALHSELERLLRPHGVQLRYVDAATGSHSLRDALPGMQWAEIAVIWGATPLPHKVSRLYTDDPPEHLRVVKFARRGIEALCREVLRSLG